jgi:phenylalanyl-tRNA synthetase alpha subunit
MYVHLFIYILINIYKYICRWREDYFPFTEPSFELDIFFNGDWMEVLGCGVIHDEVMANAGMFIYINMYL